MWDSLHGEENSPRLFKRALNSSVRSKSNYTFAPTCLKSCTWLVYTRCNLSVPLRILSYIAHSLLFLLRTVIALHTVSLRMFLHLPSQCHLQLWESAETPSLISKVISYMSHSGVFWVTNRRTNGVSRTKCQTVLLFFWSCPHALLFIYFFSFTIFLFFVMFCFVFFHHMSDKEPFKFYCQPSCWSPEQRIGGLQPCHDCLNIVFIAIQ